MTPDQIVILGAAVYVVGMVLLGNWLFPKVS